jgi:hypothetical protein
MLNSYDNIITVLSYKHFYIFVLYDIYVRRRLKRQWPSDLKDKREEEEWTYAQHNVQYT